MATRALPQYGMWLFGWIAVRPIRWFFWQMIVRGSFGLHWFRINEFWYGDSKHWVHRLEAPNLHWFVLYHTVFKFFKWLSWEAWRPLCKVGKNGFYVQPIPRLARFIRWVGDCTAGYTISGHRCFHCGREEGCPVELAGSEDPAKFELLETGTSATMDGTDHWFVGITTCPCCGHQQEYKDGSL